MNDTTFASNSPFPVFPDEMGFYFDLDGQLRRALLKVPGVPDADYAVNGDLVFVFKKLVELVYAPRARDADGSPSADGTPSVEFVASLLPQAWVAAEVATVSYGIVPEPYVLHTESGSLRIRHRPFNALLPGVYPDLHSAQLALATLLRGGVIAGEGEFIYRGQPMTSLSNFDLAALPARPKFNPVSGGGGADCSDMTAFHAGLPGLTAATYSALKQSFNAWCVDGAAASVFVGDRARDLWRDVAGYGIGALNDKDAQVPLWQTQDAAALRRLYPEMSMLNDGSLCEWFTNFTVDCLRQRGLNPSRNDEFLLYLLGAAALDQPALGYDARDTGKWAALALLQGASVSEAISAGIDATKFGAELSAMVERPRDALSYLAVKSTGERSEGR